MSSSFGTVAFANELKMLVPSTVTGVGHLSLGFALRSFPRAYASGSPEFCLMCDQSGAVSLSVNYCTQYIRLDSFHPAKKHFLQDAECYSLDIGVR